MKSEAEVYVVYKPGDGFLTGRNTLRFADSFEKARVYNRECDAKNAMRQWQGTAGTDAIVVPVQLILDPKALFKSILKGK